MLKFISNTAVTVFKVYAVVALVSHLSRLEYKVGELEREVNALKTGGEG